MPPIQTLASGLEGGFGINTFEVLKSRYDHIQLVNEAAIRKAMAWMVKEHQWIIEGSAAAAIAACFGASFPISEGPIVVVLSGRNVAFSTVQDVLNRH